MRALRQSAEAGGRALRQKEEQASALSEAQERSSTSDFFGRCCLLLVPLWALYIRFLESLPRENVDFPLKRGEAAFSRGREWDSFRLLT